MLGSLRFVLAALVALSHDGLRLFGLHPGVVAVIGFYCLSGYVMAGLLHRHYAAPAQVPRFYADRALRIFPAYYAFAAATLGWYLLAGQPTPYLRQAPDAAALLENLLVVPLNWYMFNGADAFTLIPPAWSLGAELQFYLLAPFLLRLRPRWYLAVLGLSLGVQAAAGLGLITTDWWGYRLLPGVLFVFLLGAALYRCHRRGAAGSGWALVALAGLAAAAWAGVLAALGALGSPHNRELLVGVVLAVLAAQGLAPRARRRWDDGLGHLSYGVFLGHFLVLWSGLPLPQAPAWRAAALLGWSVALAATVHLAVERPALAIRRRMRHARR